MRIIHEHAKPLRVIRQSLPWLDYEGRYRRIVLGERGIDALISPIEVSRGMRVYFRRGQTDVHKATTSRSIMALSDYADAQTAAIDELVKDTAGPLGAIGPHLSDWEEFRKLFWKPQKSPFLEEDVSRGDNPVDIHLLPPRSTFTPPKQTLINWGLQNQRILVRSEYGRAEEGARSSNDDGDSVFGISGHPGIGALPSPPIMSRI